ncbi:unnamed protein product [Orchesella dallaii]|uniref:Uncharacterized protein n=1 Tax=Orchesella dallaii TaxID=48710 RepID=A0ABP1RRN5_9HEXA
MNQDLPAEYPEEPEAKYLNDTFGNGHLNEYTGNDNNGIIPVSFKHIPDLDCLDEYFQRVKDWVEQNRKFNERIAEAARTRKGDKTIVTLRAGKIIIPYLGFEYEYDFDPVDFENENHAKYVPPIFRLFTNSNQNILDLLPKKTQESASSHYEDEGLFLDSMLPKPPSNHSIEVHINMDEDFL